MNLIRFFSTLVLLASILTQSAWSQPALPKGLSSVQQVEGISEYHLANGLQVLLVPDDAKPTTTVNLTVRVGSRHESYGETGMAHLLEHLLFKGTPTNPKVWAEFAKRGLRANGSTSFDRTNYFASFAANAENQRWYLSWLADAMVNSFIARADLDTEMTVVRNEMEMGENNPGRILLQQTMSAMYQWHNYSKFPIGARSDVENVDITRLQAFYRQHYQPDNATLIIAGKFDAKQTLQWVSEMFGPLAKPERKLSSTYTVDPAQDGERTVQLRRVGGTPIVYVGYHVPPGAHPDYAAVQMLSSILGDDPGGRLHKRLVQTQLAAQAYSFTFSLAEPGPLFIGMELAPGQDLDKARTAMLATIDDLSRQPFTGEELERARTQYLNNWVLGFNDPERVGVALSEAVSQGDWRLYFRARDQVKRVTVADVQRVASERLRQDNRTVATYLPVEKAERAPAPERVDVAKVMKDFKGEAAVAQAEAFDPTPANLDARTQRFALPSGLKVAVLPKGTRGQTVQATLRLRLGDEQSLRGQATAGAMLGNLLDKGGAGLSRQQVADEFDRLRARVNFGVNGQFLNVGITTVRDNLPAVVKLVGRLLRDPTLPADALEEGRRQWLTGIEQQRKEPGAVVSSAIARHGNPYPRGDVRYAATFDEQVEDVRGVKLEQVKAFHRRFVSAAQGEFSASGDMDVAALRAALESTLGDWAAPAEGARPFVRVPSPAVTVAPERFMLRTPDKQNANLLAILRMPVNDTHEDFVPLTVANHLFGSGGTGRLWLRVREKDGLSYDVRSGVVWNSFEAHSRWMASAIFAPQNQPKVEAAFKEELERSLKDGFTQKEIDEARNGLLSSRKLARAQDGVVSGALAENLYLGRSFARAQEVDTLLTKVTLEQVNAAWRRHMDPAKVVWAWGGDFK